MASSKLDESFLSRLENEHLECPLCFNVFRQPKSLMCMHTFCQPCLQDYIQHNPGEKIICPTCKDTTKIPGGGVGDLKLTLL